MTKAEMVREIADKTGVEKQVVMQIVDGVMESIRNSMINGEEVFLRGFGSFIIKRRPAVRRAARERTDNSKQDRISCSQPPRQSENRRTP